jgi:hypothetical protein
VPQPFAKKMQNSHSCGVSPDPGWKNAIGHAVAEVDTRAISVRRHARKDREKQLYRATFSLPGMSSCFKTPWWPDFEQVLLEFA